MEKNIKFDILSIVCIIVFCISMSPVTLQNDTFYTIKIGEYILDNGITYMDPFSWHENLSYTFPHWLYDVMIYAIFNVGGYLGIYISTIAFACILGIILYATNVKLNKNRLLSFLMTIGVIYLLGDFIAARAQLVTYILFTLTIYSIERFLSTKKKRYPLYLIIISIMIANLHVAVWPFYFVLYLPYIGEYIIACLQDSGKFIDKIKIRRYKNKLNKNIIDEKTREEITNKVLELEVKISQADERKNKRNTKAYKVEIAKNNNVKWLILIMLICVLTGLLTPLKDAPYTYLFKTMQGNTTQNINEHLPLVLIDNKEFLVFIVIFLIILMFTDTKIRLKDLFMIGGLLLLAFISRRQTSMFILLGSFTLVNLCARFINKYDPDGIKKVEEFMTTLLGKIIVISIIVILSYSNIKPDLDDNFVNEKSYPVEATKFIKENIDIQQMKLFNEYNYGSYLLLHDIPVFIDSRADLYSPEFNKGTSVFSDFMNISGISVYYEDKFESYGITHVIIKRNSKLNLLISRDDNYKELYKDDNFCVYERLNATK